MLLCKLPRRFRSPPAVHCRLYSSHPTSSYPFRNLRAFPFKVSPYDVQRQLSPFVSGLRREKLFESIAALFLPGMGFEPLKPFRLTPVYFPGWILDAEVKGEVTYKGDDWQASAQIHNAYVPGTFNSSDYKVLSSAALAPQDPHLRETVPFSEDLLRQYDLDVVCIPYNISPFSILEIVRHLSYSEATIAQGFRFTPSSLKPTLFAAYPVLIPVYLAQYEIDTDSGKRYQTFFFEAYAGDGNAWSEPFDSYFPAEHATFHRLRSFFGTSPETFSDSVVNLGYSKRFIEIAGFSHTPHQELGQAIRDYLENALNLPSTPTALAAASVNDMDKLAEDVRVREFSPEDRTPIIEWLKLGTELAMVERMHEAMSKARTGGAHVVIGGPNTKKLDKMNFVEGAVRHLAEKSTALQAERRQIKPNWAKTEEDLVEEKSEAEKSGSTAETQTEKGSDSS